MSDTALATVTKRLEVARGFQGSFTDPVQVTKNLHGASALCHLVSPAPSCGRLPEGTAVGMAAVLVDPATETYELPGQFGKKDHEKSVGLGKVALDKIAQAAGVSWDPHASGRLDDGSNPHYCSWRAVGAVRHFDGTEVRLMASKEMDLRDGSPQCDAIIERCVRKAKKDGEKDPEGAGREKARNQIREMRLHILGHAETKARLRAIRALGIRSSYKVGELVKPFVVAKLIWTGDSQDPELRRDFAKMTATAMLGGSRALYGDPPPVPALPGPRGGYAPPPPVGSVPGDPEDLGVDPDVDGTPRIGEGSTAGRRATTPTPEPTGAPRTADEGGGAPVAGPPAAAPAARPESSEKLHLPGKKDAAKPLLRDAEEKDLLYWSGRIEEDLGEERSRRPAEDRKLLEAMKAELAWRAAQGGTAPTTGATPY